ncbi:MAG: hypothetical protein R3F30_15260 [Planctomycetota bacterium]
MTLTEWSPEVRDRLVAKYPKLAGKSEGIVFCAAVLEDEPDLKLNDVRTIGRTFAPELSFSPISLSSAEVAMGRREPRKRRAAAEPRRKLVVPERGTNGDVEEVGGPSRSSRLNKIEKKLGIAVSVLEQYEQARHELERAREALHNLNPTVVHLMAELDEDARKVLEREGLLSED